MYFSVFGSVRWIKLAIAVSFWARVNISSHLVSSLHWLKINERINYKLSYSYTHSIPTISQRLSLHNCDLSSTISLLTRCCGCSRTDPGLAAGKCSWFTVTDCEQCDRRWRKRDCMLDGDQVPSPKRWQSPLQIFGPCVLWANGWMDQDATWHEGRPQPRRLC